MWLFSPNLPLMLSTPIIVQDYTEVAEDTNNSDQIHQPEHKQQRWARGERAGAQEDR